MTVTADAASSNNGKETADGATQRECLRRQVSKSLSNLSEEQLNEVASFIRHLDEAPSKAEVMSHLQDAAFVKLAPSHFHGVGVFAVRKIPKGVNPFHVCNARLKPKEQWVSVTEAELKMLQPGVRDLCRSFFAPLTDETDFVPLRENGGMVYGINATGTSTLDASWYLNHSVEPNVEYTDVDTPSGEFNSYVTLREIQEGEELLLDYVFLGEEFLKLVQ